MANAKIRINDKARELIDELATLRLKQSSINDKEAEVQAELEAVFEKYFKNQKFIDSGTNKATLVKRLMIKYDPEELEKIIKSIPDRDEDMLSECITKNIIIDNYPGLVEYLKPFGVDPNEVKKFLHVEKNAVNAKVLEYFDQKTAAFEELKKAIISAKISKSIKIT